jgi:biopolymer transport protein ExbD
MRPATTLVLVLLLLLMVAAAVLQLVFKVKVPTKTTSPSTFISTTKGPGTTVRVVTSLPVSSLPTATPAS